MKVAEMTMKEFAEKVITTKIALLPLGSTEEHGNHLPLDTDTMQVYETALLAAKKVDFFICPPLHYGYCRSTGDHPGTISITPNTLRAIVFDIAESLYKQGIRGLILASGHAGGMHMSAIEEAAEKIAEKFEDMELAVICEYHLAVASGKEGIVETENDGHAGEIETSRILAIAPDLVKGTSPEEYPHFDKPFISRNKVADWPGGVWGDPSKASVEKGHALYTASSNGLVELVKRMKDRMAASSVK